ncbi:unnamed protein product [Prunus armeniaca]
MQVRVLHPGEQSHPGVRPSGRLSRAWRKAGTRPIPPWSYLPYASRRRHGWDEVEARWSTMGLPVLAASLLPRAERGGQYCRHRAVGQRIRPGPQEA